MNNVRTAVYWKEQLGLIEHIEGGAFKEIYRSTLQLPKESLTQDHNGNRAISTSIYFLLEFGEFSAFHKIASDEIWHHYDGAPLCVYEIKKNGELIRHILGLDIANGEMPQVVIEAGSWFASRVEVENGFTLSGCTVAPGFDFEDFELAEKRVLQDLYPQYADIIKELCK